MLDCHDPILTLFLSHFKQVSFCTLDGRLVVQVIPNNLSVKKERVAVLIASTDSATESAKVLAGKGDGKRSALGYI